MPVILSNIAAAVAALGKQVTLVNVASSTETGREADAAPDAGRVILETTDADNGKAGAAWSSSPAAASLAELKSELALANQELAQSLTGLERAGQVEDEIGSLTASTQALIQKNQDILAHEGFVSDLSRLSFLSGTSRRRARFGTPI